MSSSPIAPPVASTASIDTHRFLDELRLGAQKAGVFAEVELDGSTLRCKAKDAAAEAWYSILRPSTTVPSAAGDSTDTWWVRLATADRWLSESIEADLMHFGDPMEELVEEELVELGHDVKADGGVPTIKHFRSEDKLYTFENPIPLAAARDEAAAVRTALRFLLAYEAAFRQLGDMEGGDEE